MVTKRQWLTQLRREFFDTDSVDMNENMSKNMSPEVLNTGFTEQEFEEELERREGVLKSLENSVVRHAKKYEEYLEKAAEQKGDRKIRYLLKAKQQQIKHDIKNQIYDKLMRHQLFLVKLLLHHTKIVLSNSADKFDFQIDIGDLPVDEIAEGLEAESDQRQTESEVIEEVEMEMDLEDDAALSVDLSDLRAEAAEMEADDIAADAIEVNSSIEDDINEEIEKELDELGEIDLDSTTDGETAD